MRVVGGKYRGRKLFEFSDGNVRPTSDMARESFFNIIKDGIEGASFVDLFSGTGAMGIEALSRGAGKVYFNDLSRESVELTKKNLGILSDGESFKVTNYSATDFFSRMNEKFDFVYLDPPYASDLGEQALGVLSPFLNENGVAVLEGESETVKYPKELYMYDQRRYGRAVLSFFRLKKPCAVFAGTFDPVTVGHERVIEDALKKYGRVLIVLGENPKKTPFFSKEDRLSLLKETFKKTRGAEVYDYRAIGNYEEFLREEMAYYYVRGIRDEKDMAFEKEYEKINKELYPFVETVYIEEKDFASVSSGMIRDGIEKGDDMCAFIPERARKLYRKLIKKAKK